MSPGMLLYGGKRVCLYTMPQSHMGIILNMEIHDHVSALTPERSISYPNIIDIDIFNFLYPIYNKA